MSFARVPVAHDRVRRCDGLGRGGVERWIARDGIGDPRPLPRRAAPRTRDRGAGSRRSGRRDRRRRAGSSGTDATLARAAVAQNRARAARKLPQSVRRMNPSNVVRHKLGIGSTSRDGNSDVLEPAGLSQRAVGFEGDGRPARERELNPDAELSSEHRVVWHRGHVRVDAPLPESDLRERRDAAPRRTVLAAGPSASSVLASPRRSGPGGPSGAGPPPSRGPPATTGPGPGSRPEASATRLGASLRGQPVRVRLPGGDEASFAVQELPELVPLDRECGFPARRRLACVRSAAASAAQAPAARQLERRGKGLGSAGERRRHVHMAPAQRP